MTTSPKARDQSIGLPPVVIIAGATASGKSSIALDAAERFGGEIVNADSMQVYRDLDILTAAPSAQDFARVPHHLFGFLDVSERCSVGRWLTHAQNALTDIHARQKLPIIVGGTGLYLKVLMEGLAPVPEVPTETVDAVSTHFDEIGGERFRSELALVDAEAAARLPITDRQRLIRAASVFASTGRTLSDWQQEQSVEPGYPGRFLSIVLSPPRDQLYAQINDRFDVMMAQGALAEAERFAARDIPVDLPAARAVGVAQLVDAVRVKMPLPLAIEKAKTASRNLAKRQITWFARQIQKDLEVFEKYSERDHEKIFSFIRQFLLTDTD